ncbi:hypothetical protein J6590_093571, partial [Homalodisca vitripennis]
NFPIRRLHFFGKFTKAATLVRGWAAVHDEAGQISSPEPANPEYGPALGKGALISYHKST